MQFDVFANPIVGARRAYPYVVALQSDLAHDARDCIVAPVAPRRALAAVAGVLTPVVVIDSSEHVVLIPALAGVRRRDLSPPLMSLTSARAELLAAIDYVFFGV